MSASASQTSSTISATSETSEGIWTQSQSLSQSSTTSMSSKSPPGPGGTPSTPANCTPIRNKALDHVRSSQVNGRSPKLQIPASPIMERLGYGTGVGVFLLERSPRPNGIRSPWAIKKTVKVPESNELFAARIQYEAGILKQLSHPNIIGYRAFGISSPDSAFLAMEKASTSLYDLIEERVNEVLSQEDVDPAAPFPAKQMEKVALDVGKALTYLHDEVRMVHGDMKSANVLVFGDFDVIKLCDFGVARKLAKDGTVEGNYVGTEVWNPMEVVLRKKGDETKHIINGQTAPPITHKADIYPFGLTIHEMITLKPPHLSSAEDSYLSDTNANESSTSLDETADVSFDEEAYENALARYVGTRPLLPEIEFDDSYNIILGIFYCCTDEDPTRRPDASMIVAALTTGAETK